MKYTVISIGAALLLLWTLALVNCSSPLENIEARSPSPTGPGTVYDTITDIDTLLDSDTVVVVDTLVIIAPDADGSYLLCSFIARGHPEIVWMLQNAPGDYLLQFAALPESEHPAQKLTIDIDGSLTEWTPATDGELVTEAELGMNALMRIYPQKPPSLGHSVHICLTISRL